MKRKTLGSIIHRDIYMKQMPHDGAEEMKKKNKM